MGIPLIRQISIHLRPAYRRGISRESFRIHTNAGFGGGGYCRVSFDDGADTCYESLCECQIYSLIVDPPS